jgi:hypothetical protein
VTNWQPASDVCVKHYSVCTKKDSCTETSGGKMFFVTRRMLRNGY